MLLQPLQEEVALKSPKSSHQSKCTNRGTRQDGNVRERTEIGGAMQQVHAYREQDR